jgi:hypothetical protein
MSDFKQKLEQRKQEIMQQKGAVAAPSAESTLNDRMDIALYKLADTFRKLLVGACLFCLLFTYFLFRDWWGFVGSQEYAEYKHRIQRESKVVR